MTREETIRVIRSAGTSEDITDEILHSYYRYFHDVSKESIDRIFDEGTRDIIGHALTREWNRTYNLLGQGYNNVECPIGATIYRNRLSKLHMKWQHMIPDNMPLADCKVIFLDICDRWEPSRMSEPKHTKPEYRKNILHKQEAIINQIDEVPF